jgi:hypothetical protein
VEWGSFAVHSQLDSKDFMGAWGMALQHLCSMASQACQAGSAGHSSIDQRSESRLSSRPESSAGAVLNQAALNQVTMVLTNAPNQGCQADLNQARELC